MKNNLRNKLMLLAVMSALCGNAVIMADDYEDDIYYNPKKENTSRKSKKKASNYISNFQDQDVDSYNLRGQYYSTPIDTIGAAVSNGEDFVYTQAIQNYYNPTIVANNAELVEEVLNNAYGNVEVVYNINGIPSFSPYYYSPASFTANFGPFSIGFSDPLWWPNYSWQFGLGLLWSWPGNPTWGWNYPPYWGSSWGWSYPSWAWGPSWGWCWNPAPPVWGGGRPHYDYRPGGRIPSGPRPGWASHTRPNNPGYGPKPGGGVHSGGNYNGGHHSPQPGYNTTRPGVRPGNAGQGAPGYSKPANNNGGNVSVGRRDPSKGYYGGNAGNHNSGSTSAKPGSNITTKPTVSGTGRPTNNGTVSNSSLNRGTQGNGYNSGGVHRSDNSSHSSGYNSGSHSSGYNSGSHSSGYNSGSHSSGYNSGSHSSGYNSGSHSSGYNSSRSSGSYNSGSHSSGSSRGSAGSFGGSRGGFGGHTGGGRGGRR